MQTRNVNNLSICIWKFSDSHIKFQEIKLKMKIYINICMNLFFRGSVFITMKDDDIRQLGIQKLGIIIRIREIISSIQKIVVPLNVNINI